MPRKKAAKFKCAKCGKAFGMAMHLGRHMTTIHGRRPAKSAGPKKAGKKRAGKPRRVARVAGAVGRLGLPSMSLDQLVDLIAAAKAEAAGRIDAMLKAIR